VVQVPLIARTNLSHDTIKFTFGLPTADTVLGLPVGACVKFYAPNVTGVKAGEWNGRDDPEKVCLRARHHITRFALTPS